MKERSHCFMGLKRPEGLAFSRLLQRLREAGIDGSTLCGRVFARRSAVNDQLWSENDPASLCRGFNQVAVNEAQVEAETTRYGHLTFALQFDDGAHSGQFPEAGNSDSQK